MSYADVDDLREYLGYQRGVEADSPLLDDALTVAQVAVDDYTGRTFGAVGTASTRIFLGWTHRILIDDCTTVTLVEQSSDRHTWTTVTSTAWWTEPANTTPITTVVGIAPFLQHVRVTGTWGHAATVPAAVKRATLMIAARYHKRRDSVTGVEGFGDFGVVRINRSTDSDVAALLDPLRRADKTLGLA